MNCCYQGYEGCNIKGIPIGIPFKSKFFIPKSKRSEVKDDVDIFVLLRFNTSWIDGEVVQNLDSDLKPTAVYQGEQTAYRQNNLKEENHYTCILKSPYVDCSQYTQDECSVMLDESLEEMGDEKSNEIMNDSIKTEKDFGNILLRLFHVDILRVLKGLQVMDLCKTVCTRRDREKSMNEETIRNQRRSPDDFLETSSDLPSKKLKINKPIDKQGKRGRCRVSRSRSKSEMDKIDTDLSVTLDEPESKITSKEKEIVRDNTDKSQMMEISENHHKFLENASFEVRNSYVIQSDTNTDVPNSEIKQSEKINHISNKCQKGKKRKHSEHNTSLSSESNKIIDEEKNIVRETAVEKTEDIEEDSDNSVDVDTQDLVCNEENKTSKLSLQKSDRNPQKILNARDVKKKKVMKDNAGEESDPDLQGLSIKEKLQVMRQRKKIEKESQRIKVKLQDHPDKYRIDIMDSFARKDRGKSRYESATEIFVCTVCEKFKAKSMDSMESHIESHVNGELNCDKCPYIATFINDLIRHKREVHKKNINICYECGVETNGPDGLKDHLGKVHGKPQYKCKFCLKEKGEHFAEITKHNYRQHIRKVHPEQMSACPTCSRLFANATMLKRHLDLGCAGNMPSYACEKCGKTYNSQDRVNDHVRRVHNKVRRFQCPHCPFTAARGAGLNQHLHIHTGYHPFKCDQCTFTCVQKYQLTSHMRTHNGLKPYKCSQCNFAAAWNVQLKDHMKVHGMINTVVCEVCNILFKDMRTYKTHASKEHPEAQQTITETLEVHQPLVQTFETQQVLLQPLGNVNFMNQQTSFQPLPNHNQFLQPLE